MLVLPRQKHQRHLPSSTPVPLFALKGGEATRCAQPRCSNAADAHSCAEHPIRQVTHAHNSFRAMLPHFSGQLHLHPPQPCRAPCPRAGRALCALTANFYAARGFYFMKQNQPISEKNESLLFSLKAEFEVHVSFFLFFFFFCMV